MIKIKIGNCYCPEQKEITPNLCYYCKGLIEDENRLKPLKVKKVRK